MADETVLPDALNDMTDLEIKLSDRLASSIRERDGARGIVRDIYWMALRYADGRRSYAPGMCNDAVKIGYDAGWLHSNPTNTPKFAAVGDKSDVWSDLDEARIQRDALQARVDTLEGALRQIQGNHDSCNDEDWCGCGSCLATAALTPEATHEG